MGQSIALPATALVVEDDRERRHLAAAVLEEANLRVVEIETGEEALEYLLEQADTVVLIFVDVTRPRIVDDMDLVRLVSRKWPWIQMIVTSGGPENRSEYLPQTATYMPKPWRALDVLVAAERAMARNA